MELYLSRKSAKCSSYQHLKAFNDLCGQKPLSDEDFCLSLFSFTKLHFLPAVRYNSVNMHSYILIYHICAGLPIDTLLSFFFFSFFCDFSLFYIYLYAFSLVSIKMTIPSPKVMTASSPSI